MLSFALLLAAGCTHRPAIRSTTQMSPATMPSAAIPQPPLRQILRDLSARGATDARDATVFVLSHWVLDKGTAPDQKRIFEGAPFSYQGAKVFLSVGPIDVLKKPVAPPARDLIVRTQEKDSRGISIVLAGQRWQAGFTIKGADESQFEQLARQLLDSLHDLRSRTSSPAR